MAHIAEQTGLCLTLSQTFEDIISCDVAPVFSVFPHLTGEMVQHDCNIDDWADKLQLISERIITVVLILDGDLCSVLLFPYGPRQANLVLITYASSEGSGEPAHPRSLARTFAARSYKQ